MYKKINFSAGPSALPESVVNKVAEAIQQIDSLGISLLSVNHRSDWFYQILLDCSNMVKSLCNLPFDEYDVIQVQGGGRMQFAMLPLNYGSNDKKSSYLISGHWANDAYQQAKNLCKAEIAGNSAPDYKFFPSINNDISNSNYLHITTNNTIFGTQQKLDLDVPCPMVADMSSDFLSIQRDFKKYSLIYVAAQKNLGIAGNTLVIIDKKFLATCKSDVPALLQYKNYTETNSLYNTANVVGIYTTYCMLQWTQSLGGVANIHKINYDKQALLYNTLEKYPHLFSMYSHTASRSWTNITFNIENTEYKAVFDEACKSSDIIGIEGHRFIGGYRVSLYNAITFNEVELLCSIINETANRYG